MEAIVQHLQSQVDLLMQQMERVTIESGHVRQQSDVNMNDWRQAAARMNIIQTEVQQLSQAPQVQTRELNFVDIKTMKPPVFAKPNDNFQSWVKKAKNYLEANCEGIKASLETIEFKKEPIIDEDLDALTQSTGLTNTNQIDRKMYQFLMAYTDGTPMTCVENANGRGF